MIVFDKHWFKEHQKQILTAVNSPVGWFIRRGLWIEDKKNPVVKITPESVHVLLPDGQVKATIYSNKQYQEAIHRNYKPIWEALHWWDMKLANRLVPAWNLGFDTYTSQPDDTTGFDTRLVSTSPTTNGDGTDVRAGKNNLAADVYRSLIKFDYSSIPTSISVTSKTLTLTISIDRSSNARDFKFYRVLRNWSETQATWNVYTTGNNWTTAGCGGAGTDYDSTVLASTNLTATETVDTAKTWSFDTTIAKQMIDGTYSNYGYLFMADTENDDAWIFYASNEGTASKRPKMEIVYTVVTSTGQVIWFS